jgi:hypothetical protein
LLRPSSALDPAGGVWRHPPSRFYQIARNGLQQWQPGPVPGQVAGIRSSPSQGSGNRNASVLSVFAAWTLPALLGILESVIEGV